MIKTDVKFSGDDLKGDVTFPEWRFEIRCLDDDPEITQSQLVQAIRHSLRGTARRMLIPLGEKATPRDVLSKLDALFGDTSTHSMLMQEFFNSAQKSGESVTNFGCRLESLLQTAIDNGSLSKVAKNDLLRHKFWTSLSSEKLKSQTRHKYDSITSYNELLREIRTVDREINSSVSTTPGQGQKKVKGQSQAVSCEVDQQQVSSMDQLSKEFDRKLKTLEEKLGAQIDSKLDMILSKLGDSDKTDTKQGPRFDRGRGYRGRRGGYRSGQEKNGSGSNPN